MPWFFEDEAGLVDVVESSKFSGEANPNNRQPTTDNKLL
jgi:hypothetical protein